MGLVRFLAASLDRFFPASLITRVRSFSKRSPLLLIKQLLLSLMLFCSTAAYALSIGDLTVSSAVGERFYGIIKLEGAKNISPNDVVVSLAPRSVYQRMGVDWEYFHTTLIFDVLDDERNGIYIRAVSSDVVFEPYIDFVLVIRWPRGYISKQYTVLLEMPALQAKPSVTRKTVSSQVETPLLNSGSSITAAKSPSAPNRPLPAVLEKPKAKTPVVATIPTPIIPQQKAKEAEVVTAQKPANNNTATEIETAIEKVKPVKQPPTQAKLEKTSSTAATKKVVKAIEAPAPIAVKEPVKETVVAKTDITQEIKPQEELKSVKPKLEVVKPKPSEPVIADVPVDVPVKEAVAKAPLIEKPIAKAEAVKEDLAQKDIVKKGTVKPAEEKIATKAKASAQTPVVKKEAPVITQQAPAAKAEAPAVKAEAPVVKAESPVVASVVKSEVKKAVTKPAVKTTELVAEDNSARWLHQTKSGDTLWRVARDIREQNGGNLKQIVDALHKNNPEAFMGNDANRLKVNARLAVTMAQIRAMAPASQRAQLAQAAAPQESIGGADQAGASNVSTSEANNQQNSNNATSQTEQSVADNQNGVLSLVANDSSNKNDTNISPETVELSERSEELSQGFEKQSLASKQRGDNVADRIDNLYSQYNALSEKTEQLKELELALNRSIADKAQVNMGLTGSGLTAPADIAKNKELTDAAKIGATEKELAESKAEPLSNLQLALILLLAVIVLVLMIVFLKMQQLKRRAALADNWHLQSNQNLADLQLDSQNRSVDSNAIDADTESDIEEQQSGENQNIEKSDQTLAASRKELSEIEAQYQQASAEAAAETQGEGAVELEASVYIAYERYDEAERLLEGALEQQPDNSAMQSQLLEVYAAKGKQRHFDILAEQIGNKGDSQIDLKINNLRKYI